MKGIILAGGKGTRLSPLTNFTVKQLLSVYDKPLIYYPLSLLILSGIDDILIICNPSEKKIFEKVLRKGEDFGIKISIKEQKKPGGIPEAFIIGENFIGKEKVCLILGDNIFIGSGLPQKINDAFQLEKEATIFTTPVPNPKDFGVLNMKKGKLTGIVEKPNKPQSNLAVTGLYVYPNCIIEKAKSLKPSKRGELEITDINKQYLKDGMLNNISLKRGNAWFDCGSFDSLLEASNYVSINQKIQGLLISSPHEAAFRKGLIDKRKLQGLLDKLGDNDYKSLLKILNKES
tara:strand:+ start:17073 stop:17939 length:867 start_codon:yes stop_codon:yes gene_type:complete